jgi:hypothetical protein
MWRFAGAMSTAVAMSAALAHLFEFPAKMRYDRELYVRLHRTLYNNFGRFAGPTEVFAVPALVGLAWLRRNRRSRAFSLTAVAAGCLAAADALFWALVNPANTTMLSWRLDAIPPEWARWRNQWEYTHATRAVLLSTAMGALALAEAKD